MLLPEPVDAALLASSRLFAAIAARPESLTGAGVEDGIEEEVGEDEDSAEAGFRARAASDSLLGGFLDWFPSDNRCRADSLERSTGGSSTGRYHVQGLMR